jgi:hypothetical protein
MRQFGRVEIPQEAFIAALKMDDNCRRKALSPIFPVALGPGSAPLRGLSGMNGRDPAGIVGT